MQFIKPGINIDFVGKKRIAFIVSALMIFISVMSLVIKGGPMYGVDFAGGTLIQIKFDAPTDLDKIKQGLAKLNIGNTMVQSFGEPKDNEYLVRSETSAEKDDTFNEKIKGIEAILKEATGNNVEIRRVEMVGPQVGEDLREKALFAMFFALLFITIYISGRFELKWVTSLILAGALIGVLFLILRICDFLAIKASIPLLIFVALFVALIFFWFLKLKYAMGAIVALIHDVLITVGIFSIFNKEFSLPIIAALLTIIGYSLNDTIIVFDRIRENLRKFTKSPLDININKSINETLSRTILTSGTTLLVVVTLFILGGDIIHDFAFALLVGIVVGTYSSVYVASPILITWDEFERKK